MAGHSKWANIKHRKERADKKRGKIFSRIIKEVISAVKQGGADPKTNPKLKIAMQKAKEANVPGENIERNIKKAASSDTADFVSMTYELYGFAKVGLLVDVMTDNKNRISSEIKIATNKCGGTIASPGAVSYNFERKGLLKVLKEGCDEELLFSFAAEKKADDFWDEEDVFLITTSIENFVSLKEALKEKGFSLEEAELAMIPKMWVEVGDEDANLNITLIEWLEGIDDVDAVYHNMKIIAK